MYELFDVESPSVNPSVKPNESDAAPKFVININDTVTTAPPAEAVAINGYGNRAASPPVHAHPLTRPLTPTPTAQTLTAEYLAVWNEVKERLHMETTEATFNAIYKNAWLKNVYLRIDVNREIIVFVIAASSSSMDWMKNRLYTSMLRTLFSVTGNKEMDFEFTSQ